MRKLFLPILALIFIAISCNTSRTSVSLLVPSQKSLPQDIKKILVVNRCLSNEGQLQNTVNNNFVTGETFRADRESAITCIRDLTGYLEAGQNYEIVVIDSVIFREGDGQALPLPMTWDNIEKLSVKYGADAIISLESLNSSIELRAVSPGIKNDGIITEEIWANVTSGWRVYDCKTKNIFEEYVFASNKSWGIQGRTKSEVKSNYPYKRNVLNKAAGNAGYLYAVKIMPKYEKTTRAYFVKGNENFTEAAKYAKAREWEKAMDLWKALLNNPDHEIAGRACYNMALACEMEGNLDSAMEWAKKSRDTYGINKAASYVTLLESRMADKKLLSNVDSDNDQ